MTTQELKNKIEKVLGNSIRCLLPSYWWKNLFHSVADRIDEVEQKIDEVEQKIDDVEIPDGIPIVNSEDALNRLDLPKGSVATVTTEGIKLYECYQLTEDEYNDMKSLYNKLTRIKSVEILYDKHPQNVRTIIRLIGQDYKNYIVYLIVEGNHCEIQVIIDGHIVYNPTIASSSDIRLNELLNQYDFRYLDMPNGSSSSYQAFIVNGTSDVYTKGAGWERLAKIGDIPDENEANGTIVFYQYPELPEEARQLNIEAYNKVSNAIARGKFDFDIKIYNDGRVVNPTFITGSMGVLLFTAESEGYRYVFQCLESGSVTVETEPISGGGDTTANNEVSIITFNMPAEGEVLTEDAKKQNAESYAKIVDAFKERKAYDVKIDLAGFAFNDVDTIWLPSIYQGELVMSFDISNKSTSTKMLLIVTSDGSVDSTEISSGGTSGDITIDTEMSDTSTNAVQNKVVKKYVDDAIANAEIGGGDIDTSDFATKDDLNTKQDIINDLDTIRSGAAKGETAIQKVKTINGESIEGEGNIVIGGGETDTSNLATKEELNNLTNEVIANEEVHAAALNDLNERLNEIGENLAGEAVTKEEFNETIESINNTLEGKANASSTNEAISGLQTSINGINESLSGFATNEALSEEITNLTNEIIANEEVHAAALNDLNERKADKDEIPTKVSELDNDEGYLTEHQDVSGKLDKTEAIATYLTKADAQTTYLGINSKAKSAEWADKATQATKATQDAAGRNLTVTYATKAELNKKQDTISDLATIRSGAALGATALQSVPSEYSPTLDVLKAVYPVGAIYISTVATSPQTLFGFGTWERIQDRFLLSAGSSYDAGSTGGEATHTLTTDEMPSHKHTATTEEAGSHTHTIGNDQDVAYNSSGKCRSVHKAETGASYYDGSTGESGAHTHNVTVDNTGSGEAHNNMPPYLAVYMWKRTA